MSRRRKPGPANNATEPFTVRWHAIANPATPHVDIMSSPDPLNDDTAIIPPPSSRRVTRSQRSKRFVSLGSSSPRKQQFELEVGDNTSPQRLLVTVETEDGQPATATGTRRKLFPSPSRPGVSATTTTVPLKDSIEEESGHLSGDGASAPKRRGRPRKTNGTPIPSAAKKRGAGTPIRRTPKRQNTAKDLEAPSDQISQATPTPRRGGPSPTKKTDSLLDLASQGTPTPKRRGRPPKNRSVEPSSDIAADYPEKAASARKGRRRRQALAPEDLEEIAGAPTETTSIQPNPTPSEDEMDLVGAPVEFGQEAPAIVPSPAPEGDDGSDLWMATLSNDATPRAKIRTTKSASTASPTPNTHRSPVTALESVVSQAEGFGEGVSFASDASSVADEPNNNTARKNDTVAQEDFSMIFMDSIPSLQDFRGSFKNSLKSSVHAPGPATHDDFGEETSAIINNTLETLRLGPEAEKAHGERYELPQEHEPDLVPETEQQEGPQEEEGFDEMREDRPQESQEEAPVPLQGQQEELQGEPEGHQEEQEEQQDELDEPQEHVSGPGDGSVEAMVHDRTARYPEPETVYAVARSPSVSRDGPDELATEETTSIAASAAISASRTFSPLLSRTPRRANISPLRRRALDSTTKQMDAAPRTTGSRAEASVEAETDSPATRASNRFNKDESNIYEDSFSEIPQDVLEAATPRQPGAELVISDDEDELDLVKYAEEAQEDQQKGQQEVEDEDEDEGQSHSPEETADQSHRFSQSISIQAQQTAPSIASSVAQTDNGRLPTPDDTPPNIQTETDESPEKSVQRLVPPFPVQPRDQLASEQEMASPQQPQLLEHSYQPNSSAERAVTAPKVTPLNQMSSPAQEPQSAAPEPTHEKAPRPALSAIVRAGKVLQSVTSDPPSPEDRENQLGSPFRSSASKESRSGSREAQGGRRFSASPGRHFLSHQRQSASIDRLNDDPFGTASRNTGQGSFMQALGRSVNEATSKSHASSRGSVTSSMRITPPDEEMSWMANEGPISPNLRGDNSLREAARQATVGAVDGSVSPAPAEPVARQESQHADDETDIWEVEAQRTEPESSRRRQSFGNKTFAPLHRRAIPSPWTRKAQFAPSASNSRPSPKQPNQAEKTNTENPDTGETEEYSLLAQRQREQEAEANKEQESAAKATRLDLSSFFSSPSAIPSKLAQKFFRSKPATAIGSGSGNEKTSQPEPAAVPTNSMFPRVLPQKQFQPQNESRPDLFSPTRTIKSPEEAQIDHGSASPDTPERLEMPLAAQRKSFNPRPRQTNHSFFQASSGRSAAPTPPRMQLSHADIQRWQQETSNASEQSPESPRRFLRPLPPRNASPSKSSLRSPLKPRTPGRVVEFTSSVLSPVEQARQRQQRHLSDMSAAEPEGTPLPATASVPVADEKENQDSDVPMTDAPAEKPAHRRGALSQIVWTRQHWLFLDKLIQHRRNAPFGIQVERRADKYLGKTVKSHGEAMVLERWHLDCVDAFKAVVGGWDEGALAKRLFSLIMGEERRQRPDVERPSRARFH